MRRSNRIEALAAKFQVKKNRVSTRAGFSPACRERGRGREQRRCGVRIVCIGGTVVQAGKGAAQRAT